MASYDPSCKQTQHRALVSCSTLSVSDRFSNTAAVQGITWEALQCYHAMGYHLGRNISRIKPGGLVSEFYQNFYTEKILVQLCILKKILVQLCILKNISATLYQQLEP